MRWIRPIALGLLLLLSGCTATTPTATSVPQGPGCDRLPALLGESGPCIAQSLTVSGEVSGTIRAAVVTAISPTGQCSPPPQGGIRTNVNYDIYLAGKTFRLSISSKAPYQGSANTAVIAEGGLLAGAHANLVSGSNPMLSVAWTGRTGTVTTAADGISGTVDATMIRGGSGGQPVHLVGSWRCAAPPTG